MIPGMDTQLLTPEESDRAVAFLKRGQLVAFPTETVYGLGARLFNLEAVLSIFQVKGRPPDNPLIAHVSSLRQVEQIAEQIPEAFYQLAELFFPGPLTVVLKRHPSVPQIVSGGLDSIALRMPRHLTALRLIEQLGEPLVAPSANLSGKPSSTQAKHVMGDFRGKIAAVIDGGKTQIGIESTVVSLLGENPVLLRPGAIGLGQIEEALGKKVELPSAFDERLKHSPGTKYRHYAPVAPIRFFKSCKSLHAYLCIKPAERSAMLLGDQGLSFGDSIRGVDAYALSAHELYSLLRLADEKRYDEILVLWDEKIQKDPALIHRLTQAAGSTSSR